MADANRDKNRDNNKRSEYFDLLQTPRDVRSWATFLAVLKHGLANLADANLPASDHKVIETAEYLTTYIMNGRNTAPQNQQRHERHE